MVAKNCERCKKDIQVRQADINRGWGRFCSKSCKAKKQMTMKNTIDKKYDRWFFDDDDRHPLDIDQ
ncbi:hypothetical protein ACTXL0_07010 [Psychrobacter faecalis]|uniref:hypothetical protein n=1 Tax=Psychrobacter faecalis TaxID=180588 RepID=UPI003FD06231